MTVSAWIKSLQKFDPALEVLVRVAGSGDEDYLIFIAEKPSFTVDVGCTETEMLNIDMTHGDEGILEAEGKPSSQMCGKCKGTGAIMKVVAEGVYVEKCPDCDGTGKIRAKT